MPAWVVKLLSNIGISLLPKLGRYLVNEFKKYLARRKQKNIQKKRTKLQKKIMEATSDEDIQRLSIELSDLDN